MPTPFIDQFLKGNTESQTGDGRSSFVDYWLNPENQQDAVNQPSTEPAQEPGIFSLAAKGTARGLIETFPKFTGTATEYLGTRLGVPAMQEAGKVSREFWGKQADKFSPPESLQGSIWDNPKLMARASWWAYNLPETAVSMAASLIPGGAAYKFLRSAGALERAALVGASLVGGAAGGALEGANTFEELQNKGASPQEAALGAELMSAASAGLNAISTGKIFGKALSNRIVKFITDGTTEGLTEWLEEPSEGLIKMGLDYATPAEVWQQMKEGVNVVPLSFVTGGVAGAITGDKGAAEKPTPDNTSKRIDAVTGNMSSNDIFDLWDEEQDPDAKRELARALDEAQKREASGVRPSPINVRKEEPAPAMQEQTVPVEEQQPTPVEETKEPEIVSLQKMAEELGIDVTGMDADGAKEAIDDFMAIASEKPEETTDTEDDYTPEMDDAEFEKTLRDNLDGGNEAESGMGYIVTNIDGTKEIYKNREKAVQFSLEQDKNGNFEQIEYDKISDNAEYADVTPQEPVAVEEEAPVSQEISIKQNEPDFTQPDLSKADLQQAEESVPAQPGKESVHGEKKEPWQMTREKYGNNISITPAPQAAEKWVSDGIVKKGEDFYKINIHKRYIESALSKGKLVPAEVLAEYPDLAEKYGKKVEKQKETVKKEKPTPAQPVTSKGEAPASLKNRKPEKPAPAMTIGEWLRSKLHKKPLFVGTDRNHSEYDPEFMKHLSVLRRTKPGSKLWNEGIYEQVDTGALAEEIGLGVYYSKQKGKKIPSRYVTNKKLARDVENPTYTTMRDLYNAFVEDFPHLFPDIKGAYGKDDLSGDYIEKFINILRDANNSKKPLGERFGDVYDPSNYEKQYSEYLNELEKRNPEEISNEDIESLFEGEEEESFGEDINSQALEEGKGNLEEEGYSSSDAEEVLEDALDEDGFDWSIGEQKKRGVYVSETDDGFVVMHNGTQVRPSTIGESYPTSSEADKERDKYNAIIEEEANNRINQIDERIKFLSEIGKGKKGINPSYKKKIDNLVEKRNQLQNILLDRFTATTEKNTAQQEPAPSAQPVNITNSEKSVILDNGDEIKIGDNVHWMSGGTWDGTVTGFDDSGTSAKGYTNLFIRAANGENILLKNVEMYGLHKGKSRFITGSNKPNYPGWEKDYPDLNFEPWKQTLSDFKEANPSMNPDDAIDAHMESVQKAVNEGKPVPASVLKDYPTIRQRVEADRAQEPRFAIASRSKSATGTAVTGVQHKDVVEWVARLQKRFSIPIVPVRNINGLPSYYVEAATRASKERGIVMGLYDPYTEAVWIVSDGIRSKEEFYRTILHETAGHAGLRRIAGKDYENFLLTIANSKRYQDEIYTYAAKNQYDIITATDEWFAEQVENGKIDRSLWSRFVAAIRKAIRNLGINLDFSEQDLKELVRRSYEATTTGTAEGGTALMGQPMFSTAKEQTETPEFKRWFRDSKVVDEDGKPLVVYHGTSNPVFTKFSKNYRGGLGGKLGFWFASTGKAASQFARERFAGQGAGIYPVYLAINNPIEYKGWKEFHSHVEKLRGNKDIEFGTKSLLQQAKKRGFDGIVIRNSDTDMGGMRDDWVAFEPTQIKSAIGNRGTFDPNNPDIRFATRKNQQNTNPANILSVPPETWRGLIEREFFDKYNRMVQVQQAYLDNKQPGQSPFNVIDRIRLFMGRTGDQIDRLDKRVVTGKDSLLRRMTEDGIGLDEMDLYLYASHAKERNEHVQNINAKFSESEGGSGMTNDEADIALRDLASRNKPFEKYAKEIRALAKEAMDLRFQAGLIDKNTRDRIVSKFKNYVPLKGNSEKSKFSMMLGRGFSVTRKEFHRLFGRESKAESPFAQILIDYQEAVIRSENNAVGNELLNLIQEAGEDNILLANGRPMFTIEKQKFIPRYDKDGELLYFDPKFQLADNVMAVKRNEMVWEITDNDTGMKRYQETQPKKLSGNKTVQQVEKNFTYYITINDRAMAEGMKNLGQTKTIPFIHAINNYLRMVNTVISPSFIFTNMQRDLETAGLYMLGDENASFMLGVMKDVPNAMRGIWRDTREKTPNQWSDLYDRLKKLGGKVGFFDLQTNEQKLERLKKNVKALSKENPLRQARGALIAARDLIMDANESVEGGVRLAYFKHLLDKGVDEKKAAIAAKQLTIDFNQRGNWSTILNTLYLFANANLQGGYRFGKWALKSNRNRAIILSVTMAAMMLAMRNRWVGGDDYDRMTDNDKDNHLLFMLPGGKSLAIKVAYGFNVPVAIGNILEEAFAGKMSIGGAMSRLMVAMDRAFNPMSGGSWLQAASPTFLDPVVQLAENKNAFGSPIYKEQPAYSASVPDSQLYFKGVNPWLRETALGLNRVTGGTDKISGWADISPETVEHIAETASGGLGKFVMNTINTGLALSSSEEETEINKIPIVREFVKEPSRWVSASKAREMLKESGRTLYSVDETKEFNHLLNEAIKDKSIKPETARRMRTEFRNNQTDARKSLRKAGK